MDLLDGNRIQPAFDNREDGGEAPGCIDKVETAQALRVVILRHGGCLPDVAVDGGDFADAYAFEIHYRAAGFEELA